MRTVGGMCRRDLSEAAPEMTVSAAAKLMRRQHVPDLIKVVGREHAREASSRK